LSISLVGNRGEGEKGTRGRLIKMETGSCNSRKKKKLMEAKKKR